MTSWILVMLLICIVFIILNSNAKIQTNADRRTENNNKNAELQAVSSIVVSILGSAFYGAEIAKEREYIKLKAQHLESRKLDLVIESSTVELIENNKALDERLDEMINDLKEQHYKFSIFRRESREEYIELAWDIYDEIKKKDRLTREPESFRES